MSFNMADRHPSTREKLGWLVPNPNLPLGKPATVSAMFHDLGMELADQLHDGPQLEIALQHCIDAKDAAVRQALVDTRR